MYDFSVDELLIGATFWATGYAVSTAGSAMIIESSIRPGREFADSYKFGGEWEYVCLTKEGELFKNRLKETNVISEHQEPVLQAYIPLLCEIILEKRLNVLLSTRLISVEKEAEGYTAQICNASGIARIRAGRVIHTETPGKFGKKGINAMLLNKSRKSYYYSCDKFSVYARDNTAYLKMPVEREDTILTARQKLYDLLKTKPEQLDGFRLISIGSVFEYYDFRHSPESFSAGYENPVQAFDMGALAGKGGMAV